MLRILPCCNRPVVAAYAIAHDVGVIEIRRSPRDGRMAIVAIFAACDMSRVLAGCNDAVVARGAIAEDLCVIDGHYRYPNCRAVAVFTHV